MSEAESAARPHGAIPEHLRDYWTKGAGAALVDWGAPGDYARCVLNLGKHVSPGEVHGLCQNLHIDALGFDTNEHAKMLGGKHHEPTSAGGEVARRAKG